MARNQLLCSFCGKKGARIQRITRTYGRGASEFLVRNIPTVACPHCREAYLTAATLHELDRIKTHHRSLTVKQSVPVATFPSGQPRKAI